jgi:hypothetical protein
LKELQFWSIQRHVGSGFEQETGFYKKTRFYVYLFASLEEASRFSFSLGSL